jgi:phytoene desaturase
LSAACTLAARGHEVVVYEKNSWLGGKAAVLEESGCRFDMGPTILTMPSVLKRIFSEAGQQLTDHLELIPLDPQWRCFFEDRTVLDLVADVETMAARCEELGPGLGKKYREFIGFAQRMHRISDSFFFYRPIESLSEIAFRRQSASLSLLGDALRMRLGHSVAGTVRKFVPEPRLAQMIDHFTQYVGSAPDQSPAVLCGIASMQVGEGIWYPRGGTRAVPVALEKLARGLGVEFRAGVGAERIVLNNQGHVRGIVTDGGTEELFDAVVSNMDAVRTYRELIGGKLAASFDRRREYEPACSGVVIYLGLDRRCEPLLHHNFVFSRDPHEEFEAIYRRGQPAPDPTCYVCAPSITEPEVAPPGGEALYILVHTPYLRPDHDWKRMYGDYRRVIIDKLARTAGLGNLERHIRVERWLTPADIHERYSVLNGAIYGLASHGKFFGAFKPGNRRADVPGLYLSGGAAHPGPGMPMVLMSGWIAADALDRDANMSNQRLPATTV